MCPQSEKKYDWIDTNFEDVKKIALFFIDLMKEILNGEKKSRSSEIKTFAKDELGLDLTTNVADGLFYPGSNSVIPGPIYRMGLEPRVGAYRAIPKEVAEEYLLEMKQKIETLDSLPTPPREFYESGPGIFLTPMTHDVIVEGKTESIRCSEFLEVGELYSRKDLSTIFGIGVEGFSRGLFKAKNHSSIWLFVTHEKTPDRTPYEDNLVGDILYWDGEEKGGSDDLVINHMRDDNELLLFYREKRDQYPDFAFRFEGKFEYLDHEPGSPSKFYLNRITKRRDAIERDAENDYEGEEFVEDGETYAYVKRYERNSNLREAAINIHGTRCMICGFNFEEFYGPVGRDYIEVHHLIPVCKSDGPRKVNPESEMAVVCSNCHRMIHRNRKQILKIDVLQRFVEKNRTKK